MEAEKLITERGRDKSDKLYLIDDADSRVPVFDFLQGQSGLRQQRCDVQAAEQGVPIGNTGEHAGAALSRTWLFPCRAACHREIFRATLSATHNSTNGPTGLYRRLH